LAPGGLIVVRPEISQDPLVDVDCLLRIVLETAVRFVADLSSRYQSRKVST
jgi:hypothetical protein